VGAHFHVAAMGVKEAALGGEGCNSAQGAGRGVNTSSGGEKKSEKLIPERWVGPRKKNRGEGTVKGKNCWGGAFYLGILHCRAWRRPVEYELACDVNVASKSEITL